MGTIRLCLHLVQTVYWPIPIRRFLDVYPIVLDFYGDGHDVSYKKMYIFFPFITDCLQLYDRKLFSGAHRLLAGVYFF